MKVGIARDVACTAAARAELPDGIDHRLEHRGMLAHAEIVVRAPHGNLAANPVVVGPWKAAAAPLEIGKHPIAPLSAKPGEAMPEEAFVIHFRHRSLHSTTLLTRARTSFAW